MKPDSTSGVRARVRRVLCVLQVSPRPVPGLFALLLLASTLAGALAGATSAHAASASEGPDLAAEVLAATGLAREHDAFLEALSAGIEQALFRLEEDGQAIDPILGARLLTTAIGALDAGDRTPELAATVADALGDADLRALETWWQADLGRRIADAERTPPGFERGPPLPETRARLRSGEGFQRQLEALIAASGAVEFAVARRQGQMKAAALLRFVASEGPRRFDLRTLDRASRSMAPRLRREIEAGLPEATADVYRTFTAEELDAYLNHLRSPPFRAMIGACLQHFALLERRTLEAMRRELEDAAP